MRIPASVFVWLLLVLPLAAETWYVAPRGNDRRAGTAKAPLATIQEALRRAEQRPPGQAEIVIKAGTYPVTAPMLITEVHSSAAKGALTIRAEGQVIFSGFRVVKSTAWKRPDIKTRLTFPPAAATKIWELPFSKVGSGSYGQLSRRGFNVAEVRETPPSLLFVNGKPMSLASWPDNALAQPGAVIDPGPTRSHSGYDEFYGRGGTFVFEDSRLKTWATEKNLWLEGTLGYDWEWTFNRIAKIDVNAQTIRLAMGEVSGLLSDDWLHPGFRIVNALSELSHPGECYLDTAGKRLFLYPPTDPRWKSTSAMTGATGPLLKTDGATHLTLRGIILEGARDGLMEIANGRSITLHGMTFRRNGGDGLRGEGKTISVIDSVFEDCGGKGLELKGGNEVLLESSGHLVSGCTFRRNAWWSKVFEASVTLEGVGHRVTGCRFEDLPHMAIEARGNNFLIEGNLFRRTCREFRDMGAVYFNTGENPLHRGTVVRGNFFDDIGLHGGNRSAVYLDNVTMGVNVEGNLFRNIGATDDDWTVMVHGGGYNQVVGNVFIDCSQPCEVAFLFATWAAGQLPDYQEKWQAQLGSPDAGARVIAYPELADFLQEDAVHPPGIVVENNRVFYSKEPVPVVVKIEGGDESHVQQADNTVEEYTGNAELPAFARELLGRWR
jgi:hypothetical protein